ncbi:MAG: hypothetical protein HY735_06710 [Verrucomicrobia bacterium]|nr:hypothetical protein [Verrucomicrobiota bacterium]
MKAIVIQPDGQMIIGGDFFTVSGVPRRNLARLNQDGSMDATWDPGLSGISGGGGSGTVNCMALVSTNLYVGGSFRSVQGAIRNGLAKVSIGGRGESDPNWAPNPIGGQPASAEIYCMIADKDSLYVGGYFLEIGGQNSVTNLAKVALQGVGATDPIWKPNPAVFSKPGESGYVIPRINSLALVGSNLFVGGNFDFIGGRARTNLAKLSAGGTGAADILWVPNPFTPGGFYHEVNSIASDADNLYVAGYFGSIAGQNRRNLAKVSTTGSGSLDSAWDPQPKDEYRSTGDVWLLSISGTNLIVIGNYVQIGGRSLTNIARIGTTGSGVADDKWMPRLSGVQTIASSGSLIAAGGQFTEVDDLQVLGFAKLDSVTGRYDSSFPTQVESPGRVNAIYRQPDGKIVVGGDFLSAQGLKRLHLARINTDGRLDSNWRPDPNGVVTAIVGNESAFFVAGAFATIGGNSRNAVAKFDSLVSDRSDPAWNPKISRRMSEFEILSIALSGTNLFIAGSLGTVGGMNLGELVKINTEGNGSADPLWTPMTGGGSAASALAVDGTNLYVGGFFESIGGVPRTNLARISISAPIAVDPMWDPRPWDLFRDSAGHVYSLVVGENYVFCAGSFDVIGGQQRRAIAKLNKFGAGEADPLFAPNVTLNLIYALGVNETNVFIGGYELQNEGGGLIRLSKTDGSYDPSFAPHPAGTANTADSGVTALLVVGDDLYAGGSFTTIGNHLGEEREDSGYPVRIGGLPLTSFAFLPTVAAPVASHDTSSTLTIRRNPRDGFEVTHFRIRAPNNVNLFLGNGQLPVAAGSFITVAQGEAGLRFDLTAANGSVTVVSAVNDTAAGAGTASSTIALSSKPNPEDVFRFSQDLFRADENAHVLRIPVLKSGAKPASVSYSVTGGTAEPGRDYLLEQGRMDFAAKEESREIQVKLLDDLVLDGPRQLTIELSLPSNGTTLGTPNRTIIEIRDDEEPLTPTSFAMLREPLPRSGLGAVRVSIEPNGLPGAAWRLPWDLSWHSSGHTLSNLDVGLYVIQFRAVANFVQPNAIIAPVQDRLTTSRTVRYTSALSAVTTGNLIVRLGPDEALPGVGWRLRGDSEFQASGFRLADLLSGTNHILEFRSTNGWYTPAPRFVTILPNAENVVTAFYEPASPLAPGTRIPQTVPRFVEIGEALNETLRRPLVFVGQLRSKAGFGSGIAVRKKVVLTAAHVLFDEETTNFVESVDWLPELHVGEYESRPIRAQGWYVFEKYLRQRRLEREEGKPSWVATRASQQWDIAAIYFDQQIARNGGSGFLLSDALDNEWILGNSEKLLAGYPMGRNEDGKLFVTEARQYRFVNDGNQLFSTSEISSFPGNSGGPLCVLYTNSLTYFPAAVYLGTADKLSVFRSIDSQAAELIMRAASSADLGTNFTGGGVLVFNTAVAGARFGIQKLTVRLEPQEAVAAGAGWRVSEKGGAFTSLPEATTDLVSGTNYTVEFKSVPGWLTPTNFPVNLPEGQDAGLTVTYESTTPVLTATGNGIFVSGPVGKVVEIEFTPVLGPAAAWTKVQTVTLEVNPVLAIGPPWPTDSAGYYRAKWQQ